MTLFKRIKFVHNEKDYEIRILHDNSKINLVAFYNNHPTNGFRYQVQFSKNVDIEKFLNVENFNNLIESAKKDIINEEWNKFI